MTCPHNIGPGCSECAAEDIIGDRSVSEKLEALMTEDQIKYMAERFLGWPLPENFHPDGGISYEPVGNKGTPHEFNRRPVGTNLLDYTQALAMVGYLIDGLPS